jgi:hypothetical protein
MGNCTQGLSPLPFSSWQTNRWGSCRFWVFGSEREIGVTGDKIFFFLCLCALGEEEEDAQCRTKQHCFEHLFFFKKKNSA